MRLVGDWRKALKWFSVNIPLVNTAFLVTWATLPPKFQDALPLPWVIGIAVALLGAGIVGRLVDQTPKDKP
jgi:hypothetical protein